MSWEDDADVNEAYFRENPTPLPKARTRPFDVKRGVVEESLGKLAKEKSGIVAMSKVYEQKTGQSGQFEHGPMSIIKDMARSGRGKKKTRRVTSKRSRGRTRYASGGSRRGKRS
jgi:hypothetical protein